MGSFTFSPRQSTEQKPDGLATGLYTIATYIFIIAVGTAPLFFIPLAAAPLDYSKILYVFLALFSAIGLYSLSVLRSGVLNLQITLPVLLFWILIIATSISALFSGDLTDTFISTTVGSQTVIFLGLLGLLMIGSHIFLHSKKVMMQLYLLLYGVASVLALYHVLRLVFGPEFLAFGLTTSELFSPIGNWNDLGIFFALIVIFTLVALEQLPLPRLGQYLFASVAALAVLMLIVVQFSVVWMLLGFIALISLMFSLTRHRFNPDYHSSSPISLVLSGTVAILALVFLLGGNTISTIINDVTGIEHLEVRPSVTATIGIAQNVYSSENALFGIGPNKFVDAWRLYRDPSLNQTLFWNTDFVAGSSYLSTVFTTSGGLVAILWLVFLGSIFYIGYRMFMEQNRHDPFWHFIATSSFIGTVFLWLTALLYVPGPLILMLAALCTGVMLTSYCNICTVPVLHFDSTQNRQATAVLITAVLLVLLGSVSGAYALTTHYSATYTFNSAFVAESTEESNQRIERAFNIQPHAQFARQRALSAIGELNQTLQIAEPSDQDREAFEAALVSGVSAAEQATQRDPSDAQNWAVRAAVFSTLTAAGIDGAAERAYQAIEEAQRLYPSNPEYYALEAQIAFRANDLERARTAIQSSLQRKPDYLAGLSLLAEIEIMDGDISTAQEAVREMIRLQPNNPGLHYQLGILYIANDEQISAVTSLERAVAIDDDFANARYVLAIQYAEQGRDSEAIQQLEHVRSLNPENQDVQELIDRIEAGESIEEFADTTPEQDEILPTTQEEGTGAAPDTDLIQPVNPTADEQPTPDSASETILESPEPASENE